MREPTFTDAHKLRREEEQYWREFQTNQRWRVQPNASGYGHGIVDSTFCSIHTDRPEQRAKEVVIAHEVRGDWAVHIVELHNLWFENREP